MLIDTHAHLWWRSYKDNLKEVLERAKSAGVEKIIVPGTDLETSRLAVELAKEYPELIYAAVGVHPEELKSYEQIESLREIIINNRQLVVAIGEVGTDKHGELANTIEQQKIFFTEQLRLAEEVKLPVIVHTRESWAETWGELAKFKQLKIIFHCFSYGEGELEQALTREAWIGIGGNITWSKRIQRVVKAIPSEKLLIETDSPLMTPISKKPEQNEPANVRITAELIAQLRGVTLEELAATTTINAKDLFKI